MGFFIWIMLGVVAGILVNLLLPGDDQASVIITNIVAVAGSLLGGMLATQLGFGSLMGFDIRSVYTSLAGCLILLAGYRALRPAT